MIQYRKSWQNTARIARTARKVDICRTFVWMMAIIVPPADERLLTAVISTDRIPTVQEPGGLQVFRFLSDSCGRCGRYFPWAVPSSLSSPCVYSSAGQYTYGLQGSASGS
jgi:hypothetical protein